MRASPLLGEVQVALEGLSGLEVLMDFVSGDKVRGVR